MWQIIVGVILFIGGIGNITKSMGAFFTGIILGGLLIFLGLKKMVLIPKSHGKTQTILPPPDGQRTLREENFKAAGVNYYESNIHKLACLNPDWKLTKKQISDTGRADRKIFKNNYINQPVKLIFEPDNPHDPDAIMILVAGEKVGYIRSDENERVRFILENREVISISAFIGGGEYKFLSDQGEILNGSFGFSVNVRITFI